MAVRYIEEMQTVVGTVRTILHRNESDGWGVCVVSDREGVEHKVTGALPFDLVAGHAVRCAGKAVQDREYGKQFRAAEISLFDDDSTEGLKAFLGGDAVSGVGPKTVERVFEVYGDRTLEMLTKNYQAVAQLKGVSLKQTRAMRDAILAHRDRLEVTSFLLSHFGQARAEALYEKYGSEAKNILLANPYRLIGEVSGFAFKSADAMAKGFGVPNDAMERMQAGVLHCVEMALARGHVYGHRDELRVSSAKLLGVSELDAQRAIESLSDAGGLVPCPGDDALLTTPKLLTIEQSITSRLIRIKLAKSRVPAMDTNRAVAWAESRLGFDLEPEQRSGVLHAVTSKVSVITGPPGSGKTALLRSVVDILRAKRVRISIACATGAAAARASESAGYPASTVHRLLDYHPKEGFRRGPRNPLECDYLIVDEASMMSASLFNMVLKAIDDGTCLLIVGDADQLPSIQPGLILLDLIRSDVFPVTTLTKIHRSSGLVMQIGEMMRSGVIPPQDAFDGLHASFVPTKNNEGTANAMVREAVNRSLWPGLVPKSDVQTISPRYAGPDGVDELNRRLKNELNPEKGSFRLPWGEVIRGDRLRETKNKAEMEVYNGDVGTVRSTGDDGLVLQLPRGLIRYSWAEAQTLKPAWTITTHRSQGAEYQGCVINVDKSSIIMLDRSLLYTAWTRTKERGVLVGQRWTMAQALAKTDSLQRRTGLAGALNRALASGIGDPTPSV